MTWTESYTTVASQCCQHHNWGGMSFAQAWPGILES